jgi:hypothetical protein
MRISLALSVMVLFACGGPERDRTIDADTGGPTNCTGIECQIVQCEKMGKPPTTISGTVFAPNGTLALYGANVYVPFVDPGPFDETLTCGKCEESLPGGAVAAAVSDTAGKFTIANVPSGTDIPLFVTIGKWRRKTTIPQVLPCQDNPLPNTTTSLPKNKSEGDIPKIAITTGSQDALECLIRKMGVSDSEFTAGTDNGRVHLFVANGAAKMANDAVLPAAATLWGDLEKMKKYDIMLFSCEGDYRPQTKTQTMMENLKAYADLGGRVFLEHYHSEWIYGEKNVPTHAPPVWPTVASCGLNVFPSESLGVIDQVNNPKGSAFAQWMTNVQGSAQPGTVEINDTRQTCSSIDLMKAERWVYMKVNGVDSPQNFQFTTPVEAAKEDKCGKVVFSDMHVSSGSTSAAFPNGCSASAMSAQEKALAFMLFDIATCIGPIL